MTICDQLWAGVMRAVISALHALLIAATRPASQGIGNGVLGTLAGNLARGITLHNLTIKENVFLHRVYEIYTA